MSTLNDVLKAIKDVVVMNERVTRLAEELQGVVAEQRRQDERLVRVEAFIDLVRPAVTRRLSGPD